MRAPAAAAAWLAFMTGLIVGGEVGDVASFAIGNATHLVVQRFVF